MTPKNDLTELADGLHSAAIHLLRMLRRLDSESGIGPSQLSALSVIVHNNPMSLNQLAEAEEVRPPTMSRIIDALIMEGLVKREMNEKDRRSIVISATPKGAKLMRDARARRVKRLAELLAPLKTAELDNLKKASELISRIVGIGRH